MTMGAATGGPTWTLLLLAVAVAALVGILWGRSDDQPTDRPDLAEHTATVTTSSALEELRLFHPHTGDTLALITRRGLDPATGDGYEKFVAGLDWGAPVDGWRGHQIPAAHWDLWRGVQVERALADQPEELTHGQ